MSRTYRRKTSRGASYKWYWGNPLVDTYVYAEDIDFSQVESIKNSRYGCRYRRIDGYWKACEVYDVVYKKSSKEGKKRLAKYHGDIGSHNCKEPGPAWWRNMTSERPNRRKSKRELQKYINDFDYEPMLESKPPLQYWT